jgi:hypothetical protein
MILSVGQYAALAKLTNGVKLDSWSAETAVAAPVVLTRAESGTGPVG